MRRGVKVFFEDAVEKSICVSVPTAKISQFRLFTNNFTVLMEFNRAGADHCMCFLKTSAHFRGFVRAVGAFDLNSLIQSPLTK